MNRRELLISLLAVGVTGTTPTYGAITPANDWELLDEAFRVASKYSLFDWNDDVTRDSLKTALRPFCIEHEFYMKCDEENNPQEVVDRGEFVVEFYKNGKRRIYTMVTESVSFEEANFLNV